MSKFKIAFYINTLERGGAERVISVISSKFSDENYDVILITSYKGNNEYKISKNIQRFYLDKANEKSLIIRNVKRIMRLRKILKNNNIDCLISFMAEANIRSMIATQRIKTKCIISIRNDPMREYPGKLLKISKFLFKFVDGCVFQTNDAENVFKNIFKKSTIIANPVNNDFYMDKSIILNDEKKDIISVGRLEKQKNHKMLIEAFNEIQSKFDEKLYIYGEGNERKELEKIINNLNLKEKVFLPGMVSDLPDKLNKAKLFILSSNYEGMPNALQEALVMGVPLISTNCPIGGPKELIKNDYNGLLVNVGDTKALTEAINKVLSSRELQEKYRTNNLEIRMKYSIDSIFIKWVDFVSEVMEEK